MVRIRELLVRIGALLLFITLVFPAFFLGPRDFGHRPWRAYDLILLDNSADLEEVRARLLAAGEDPIDRSVASVRIENFLGGEWVPLAALNDRFDPADPRLDPFVRAARGLFDGAGGELVYLPRRGSIVTRRRELRSILRGVSFRVVGWNPLPAMLSGVGAIMVMLFSLRTRFARRWPIVLGLVAVAAHAAAGGPAGLVRAALVGYAWAIFLDRLALREREYLVYRNPPAWDAADRFVLVYLGISVFLAALTLIGEDLSLRRAATLSLLATVAALAAVTWLWHLVHRDRIRSSEHRLFAPRPILERAFGDRDHGSPLVGRAPWAVAALLLALALVFVISDRGGSAGDLLVPVPDHYAAEPDPTAESTSYRTLAEAARSIVPETDALSTAGYLAHRWYQDGLLYGAGFRIPGYGEKLQLRRLEEQDGGLRTVLEPVATFDEAWIAHRMGPDATGIYRIITEEGGVFVVRPEVVRVPSLPPRRTVELLAAILISLVPLGFGLRSRGVIGTVKSVSMKEQQSA